LNPSAASSAAISRNDRALPVLGDFLANRFACRTSAGVVSS
jgi:hypothetical protein